MPPPTVKAIVKHLAPNPPLAPLAPPASVMFGQQLSTIGVAYNGNTYVGYVVAGPSNSTGIIRVAQFNNSTKSVTVSPDVITFGAPDLHETPTVLVRSSDHKILVAACDSAIGLPSTHMYTALSTNAEDISSFSAAVEIGAGIGLGASGYTYPNLVQLSGESGKIYLFFAVGSPPIAQKLYFCTSTDGGATWSAPTLLWGNGTSTCYWAINSDDVSRIDFMASSGQGANGQTANLYHFYYDGAWRKTDGTSMGAIPGGGFTTTDATQVYDGTTNGNTIGAQAVTKSGPTAVSISMNPAGVNFPTLYWYHYYSAGAWHSTNIADNGVSQNTYWFHDGGIGLDSTDKTHVMIARGDNLTDINLFSYVTSDGGATFTAIQITTDGVGQSPYLRPYSPKNADPALTFLCNNGWWPAEGSAAISGQVMRYPA